MGVNGVADKWCCESIGQGSEIWGKRRALVGAEGASGLRLLFINLNVGGRLVKVGDVNGMAVLGCDLDKRLVGELNSGRSSIHEESAWWRDGRKGVRNLIYPTWGMLIRGVGRVGWSCEWNISSGPHSGEYGGSVDVSNGLLSIRLC
ncbi:hypothetical protein Tco_0319461 [Tanacetum coccineum]